MWALIATNVLLTVVILRREKIGRLGNRCNSLANNLLLVGVGIWMGITLGVKRTDQLLPVVEKWSMHMTLLVIALAYLVSLMAKPALSDKPEVLRE